MITIIIIINSLSKQKNLVVHEVHVPLDVEGHLVPLHRGREEQGAYNIILYDIIVHYVIV